MLFTAADIMNYARDRSARGASVTLDPYLEARQINDLIRSAVQKITDADEERLEEEITVSNADVIADTYLIDLTSSSLVEWLKINAIDWRESASADYEDEITVGTREGRHRLTTEHDWRGQPVAYFTDRMRSLRKVAGWSNVYDLRVYGILLPDKVDPQDADGFQRVFDYPEPMFRALCTGYLMRIATHLSPSKLELQLWQSEAEGAWNDMLNDAQSFVSEDLRVEDVPHQEFGQ